jgi:hypothetical protein
MPTTAHMEMILVDTYIFSTEERNITTASSLFIE